MSQITAQLMQLSHGKGLPLPSYETAEAAGMDLRAAVPEDAPLTLKPGERELVPTGFAMAIPIGFEAQIRPRSGLALKHGIGLVNAPGTVDSDYRGEIKIILINLGQEDFEISRGMRIAQMIIAPVLQVAIEPVGSLNNTTRGAGGFGSTGVGAKE